MERNTGQDRLKRLSSNFKQRSLNSGLGFGLSSILN